MNIEELQKALDSMPKKDIIALILSLVEEKEIDIAVFNKLAGNRKMTEYEENLLKATTYTRDDLCYIKDRIETVENRKVGLVLKGKDKFIAAIVEIKLDKHFEYCWEIYPRKVGKQLGKKAFVKLFDNVKVSEIDHWANYVLEKVQTYSEQCEENCTEEQYIMHFSTFCNSKKYL